MAIERVGQTTTSSAPQTAELPPTGRFAGRTVTRLPSGKTRRFLDLISHPKFPLKSLLARGIKTVSRNSYGYLLEKRNPLSKMEPFQLGQTIHSGSPDRQKVDDFINKKLAFHNLELTADDFHCYRASYLCTFGAVKAAMEMLDADAAGASSLNVDYSGEVATLPKVAREALETDLQKHHGLSPEAVQSLMRKGLTLPQLRAATAVCESTTDETTWKALVDVPLRHLPGPKLEQVQQMARQLMEQSGLNNPEHHLRLYFADKSSVSKESVEQFIAATKQQQNTIQQALESGDLSSLVDVTPEALPESQQTSLVKILETHFVTTGMNAGEARALVAKTLEHNQQASLADIAFFLTGPGTPEQSKMSDEKNRWYRLSDQSLTERCKQTCEPDHLDTITSKSEVPGIPEETINTLKLELRRSWKPASVSDMEVSLEILARRLTREPPFRAIAHCPSQAMATLSPTARNELISFVREEIEGDVTDKREAKMLLEEVKAAIFVKDCETSIRAALPEGMFRTEALEILDLPLGATPNVITKQYHKLSRMYHPDKTVDLDERLRTEYEAKFKEVNSAYSRLSNSGNWHFERRPIMPS